MTHGTRSCYQKGCKLLTCRAANAEYEAAYRDRKRRGLPMLGSVVSAVETWRQLRLLTTEYETEDALAERLGLKNYRHNQPIRYGRQRVRLRTALRIGRRYQLDILAGLPETATAQRVTFFS